MIGDAIGFGIALRQIERGEKLGYVSGQRAEAACVLIAEQMTIILDRGAAARGINDHSIEIPELRGERRDVRRRECTGLFDTSHMQTQRAAAADPGRDNDLAALAL